jgi:selenocysteine-specific elongation factor
VQVVEGQGPVADGPRPAAVILGTAGHIDHGKTALVRALTGVDTDRLPEEKRRGITIELGFAPLELDGIGTVGVIDVPGHEAFVRTMLAGATGVDLALVVVAADEGVMPQTREHLAILSLLGVRAGVIAITKTDLVDSEWLSLVVEEVRAALEGGPLERAEICAVSARTGEGVPALREALAAAVLSLERRAAGDDLFRMPVDRVFTLRGTGTVVTGTVWSGTLRRGSAWVHPPGRAVRVRDLQSHGRAVEAISRGMRAAVALSDTTVEDVRRGAVIVGNAGWLPSTTLRASMQLLDGARLSARTRVRLHIGSADIGARFVVLSNDQARVHLDEPVVCRGGDRFVVRGGSALTTLGGGVVLDPYARPRARALPVDRHEPRALLAGFADEAGNAGVRTATLAVRLGISPERVVDLVGETGLCETKERVYAVRLLKTTLVRLEAEVDRRHSSNPLASGLPLEEARAALGVTSDLFDVALSQLVNEHRLAVSGAHVHRRGWLPRLDQEQTVLAERMMHAFCSTPEPTTDVQVAELFGLASLPILRHLEREGAVVRLGEALVAAEPVVRTFVERLRGHMVPGRGYSPAELRDALGVSRKVLIPLLEYCDRVRVTERRGGERVLRG